MKTFRDEKIDEVLKALNDLDVRFWKLLFLTSPLKSLEILEEMISLHKDLDKIFSAVAEFKEKAGKDE